MCRCNLSGNYDIKDITDRNDMSKKAIKNDECRQVFNISFYCFHMQIETGFS